MNKDKELEKKEAVQTVQENKKSGKGLVIGCVIMTSLLVIVTIGIVLYGKYQEKQAIEAELVAKAEANANAEATTDSELYNDYSTITYEGESYAYNTDITTVLFLGIDQLEEGEEGGEAGRSDTIILMLLDSSEESVTMLSISRDTITEVDVVNAYGERILSGDMHIAIQYSYGSGGADSCILTSNTVSELLYGIPVNYYISMNLDGLESIVDILDGITITMSEDFTYINEAFVEGETLVLDGELAERFVRYRDTTEYGSNNERMVRQELFLDAFITQLKTKVGNDSSQLETMWNLVSKYLTTNMDLDMMKNLASYDMNESTYQVPGESVIGEIYDEYIVDEENLKKMLVELLYNPM